VKPKTWGAHPHAHGSEGGAGTTQGQHQHPPAAENLRPWPAVDVGAGDEARKASTSEEKKAVCTTARQRTEDTTLMRLEVASG
jgi:hypothetical protein